MDRLETLLDLAFPEIAGSLTGLLDTDEAALGGTRAMAPLLHSTTESESEQEPRCEIRGRRHSSLDPGMQAGLWEASVRAGMVNLGLWTDRRMDIGDCALGLDLPFKMLALNGHHHRHQRRSKSVEKRHRN